MAGTHNYSQRKENKIIANYYKSLTAETQIFVNSIKIQLHRYVKKLNESTDIGNTVNIVATPSSKNNNREIIRHICYLHPSENC